MLCAPFLGRFLDDVFHRTWEVIPEIGRQCNRDKGDTESGYKDSQQGDGKEGAAGLQVQGQSQ